MNKPLILVVEDDTAIRNLITTTLETQDYRFHTAPNGVQALLESVSQKPDSMLLTDRISLFWIWDFRIWMELRLLKKFVPGQIFQLL